MTSIPALVQLPQVNFQYSPSEQSSIHSSTSKIKLNTKQTAYALHQSILDGRLKQLNYFLKMGLKVDSKDKYGRTCLMLACLCDHENYGLQVAKLLFRNGADLNETDNLGRTAAFLACSEKREKIFNYFLENHSSAIDFRIKDNDGNGLINHVSVHGSLKMVKKIIEKMQSRHISVDQRNNAGYTGLLLAIKNDKFLNAYALVKHGHASTSTKDIEKCFNAVEWLLQRIEKNRDQILNSKQPDTASICSSITESMNSSFSFEVQAPRSSLIRRKLKSNTANSKQWYNTSNQYHQQEKMCQHVTSPNLSVEHHRSRYIPVIFSQRRFEREAKTPDLEKLLKISKDFENSSDRSSLSSNENLEDLDESLSLKEVVQKLYELIYNKMWLSYNPNPAANTNRAETPIQVDLETTKAGKHGKMNKQRAMSFAGQKPNVREEAKTSQVNNLNSNASLNEKANPNIDMNIFDLESMRQTPKLMALQPSRKFSRTAKDAVHSMFNMYDTAHSIKFNSHNEYQDLPKLFTRLGSKSIMSQKERSNLTHSSKDSGRNHSGQVNNRVKFSVE